MKYNFESVENRRNQGSRKWNIILDAYPDLEEDVYPLSVADMEFDNPPEIREGLKDYLDHMILGYSMEFPGYKKSVIDWIDRRHNYKIEEDWIVVTPGVVDAFYAGLKTICKEGEGVIIFKPIYHPMEVAIEVNGLKEVNIPLINQDEYYRIDFEKFEEAAKDPNNKALLFCSPHNPVGRVWKREELEEIARICLENDLKIISDEIWNDIIMEGYEHTVLASLSKEVEDITITCTSPSKSFNIAGMAIANIIVANEELREKYTEELMKMRSLSSNALGFKACQLAYDKCEDWLEEMLKVIGENRKMTEEFFAERNLKTSKGEGTFVIWIDCRPLGMDQDQLEKFNREKAKFFVTEGYIFGQEGAGYMRINLAMPKEILKKQLDRWDKALKEFKSQA